ANPAVERVAAGLDAAQIVIDEQDARIGHVREGRAAKLFASAERAIALDVLGHFARRGSDGDRSTGAVAHGGAHRLEPAPRSIFTPHPEARGLAGQALEDLARSRGDARAIVGVDDFVRVHRYEVFLCPADRTLHVARVEEAAIQVAERD